MIPSTPAAVSIPPWLEYRVLLQGPSVLRRMIQAAGGVNPASVVLEISAGTCKRWMTGGLPPVRRTDQAWHPRWAGYPMPWPAFDRICERAYGNGTSFLAALHRHHPELSLSDLLGRTSLFSLDQTGLSSAEIATILREMQVPGTTRARWTRGVPYPQEWAALDRLTHAWTKTRWIEQVLLLDPRKSTLPWSRSALAQVLRIEDEQAKRESTEP